MTSSDNTFSNRPFENLNRLLKRKTAAPLPGRKPSKHEQMLPDTPPDETKTDRELFLDAVRGVTPIRHANRPVPPKHPGTKTEESEGAETQEPYQKLKRLVSTGEGFIISQTPEYMEGTGHQVPHGITQLLHQGRFSIQDHIDLHGMNADTALEALEGFFRNATTDGLRSVLVVHGRGLSSPGEPVLKARLRQFLGSNRWRKWILAFSSARSCDGGAGATYVLLRKKPISKKAKKCMPIEDAGQGNRI